MNEERTVVVSSNFSKAFGTVSHSMLVCRLGCYSLDGWTARWVKNWSSSTWRPVIRGILENSILWPVQCLSLAVIWRWNILLPAGNTKLERQAGMLEGPKQDGGVG